MISLSEFLFQTSQFAHVKMFPSYAESFLQHIYADAAKKVISVIKDENVATVHLLLQMFIHITWVGLE